jgi:hypothetical protein
LRAAQDRRFEAAEVLTIGLPLHAQATRTASSPTDANASNDSDGANCTALTALIIAC